MTRCVGLLRALALAACLAAATRGQDDATDPRTRTDPREATADPRDVADPRDAAVEAQDARNTERLVGIDRLEDLYERGELGDLGALIELRPWELLPWLDGLCEQWLELHETPGGPTLLQAQAVTALREKIERVARLADRAIGDTAFEAWTARVLSWGSEERAAYREAQVLYVRGLTLFGEADTLALTREALTPLEQALERLRPLGPTWETTMTLTLIGRIQLAHRELDAARGTMTDALRLGRSLRDLDAVWNGLTTMYEGALADGQYDRAIELLKDQYRICLETGDEATARQVVERLVALDDFRERTDL